MRVSHQASDRMPLATMVLLSALHTRRLRTGPPMWLVLHGKCYGTAGGPLPQPVPHGSTFQWSVGVRRRALLLAGIFSRSSVCGYAVCHAAAPLQHMRRRPCAPWQPCAACGSSFATTHAPVRLVHSAGFAPCDSRGDALNRTQGRNPATNAPSWRASVHWLSQVAGESVKRDTGVTNPWAAWLAGWPRIGCT